MREISFSPARVAVLVDGDNIPVRHAGAILGHAHREGRPDIRRVYGDLAKCKGWEAAPGFRAFHAGTGKNAADLMIAIDAMELALAGGVGHFVLVSSDRDFTHLAHRLRELGHGVTGLGEEKAPESFRAACTAFHVLDCPAAPILRPAAKTSTKRTPKEAIPLVRKAMASCSDKDGWYSLSPVGKTLRQQNPGFRPNQYGHAKLVEVIEKSQAFQTRRGKGNHVMIAPRNG